MTTLKRPMSGERLFRHRPVINPWLLAGGRADRANRIPLNRQCKRQFSTGPCAGTGEGYAWRVVSALR
jgi:hypothetical protein